MILGYGLRTRRFNKAPNIVGRTVEVNGEDCMIIGVMPADFNFPLVRGAARTPYPYVEFWTPFRLRPADPAEAHGGFGRQESRPDLSDVPITTAAWAAFGSVRQAWS